MRGAWDEVDEDALRKESIRRLEALWLAIDEQIVPGGGAVGTCECVRQVLMLGSRGMEAHERSPQ